MTPAITPASLSATLLLLVWAVRSSNGNRVRFGRKLKLAPTVQIKHQLLLRWLADQTQKEAAEANVAIKTAAKVPRRKERLA